jgi:hypothetical protein
MIKIDGIVFDNYKVKSVELELGSCKTTLKVEFRKDNKRITKEKEYHFLTNCDVNINKLIEDLEQIIKNG